MTKQLNVDELIEVLHDLDSRLREEVIVVRAVGGFALAWRHLRKNGLTADIDTVTDDYPPAVQSAIADVGKVHGLDPWWLNNDVAADDADFLIEQLDLHWELVPCGFTNIVLYVAETESLLQLKLRALEDSPLSGRKRDLEDTIRILVALGVTKDEFLKRYRYMEDDMPYAYRTLSRAIW